MEAHCVVEWGDFRPAYLRLATLTTAFPASPVLALTGTGTNESSRAIRQALGRPDAHVIVGDSGRSELVYHCDSERPARLSACFDRLCAILQQHSGQSGIVFFANVKAVNATVEAIHRHFGDFFGGRFTRSFRTMSRQLVRCVGPKALRV